MKGGRHKLSECVVPNTSARTWTCPQGHTWDFREMKSGGWQEAFAELWHGKSHMRNADGSRL